MSEIPDNNDAISGSTETPGSKMLTDKQLETFEKAIAQCVSQRRVEDLQRIVDDLRHEHSQGRVDAKKYSELILKARELLDQMPPTTNSPEKGLE
jgi:hypothetical protein